MSLRAYVRELGSGQEHYFGSIDALCGFLQSAWPNAGQSGGSGPAGAGLQDSPEPRIAPRSGACRARR